jgi:hypothetical protein
MNNKVTTQNSHHQNCSNAKRDENYYRQVIQDAQSSKKGLVAVKEGVELSGLVRVVACKSTVKSE